MTHKYRFTITYQNKNCIDVGNFMRCLDVSIGDFCVKEVFEFTTKKDEPVQKIKDLFEKAFSTYDCKIVTMEGGKIE